MVNIKLYCVLFKPSVHMCIWWIHVLESSSFSFVYKFMYWMKGKMLVPSGEEPNYSSAHITIGGGRGTSLMAILFKFVGLWQLAGTANVCWFSWVLVLKSLVKLPCTYCFHLVILQEIFLCNSCCCFRRWQRHLASVELLNRWSITPGISYVNVAVYLILVIVSYSPLAVIGCATVFCT